VTESAAEESLRVLAISDVRSWVQMQSLTEAWKPDVVVLGGDLVHDGGVDLAPIWKRHPEFQEGLARIHRKFGREPGGRMYGKPPPLTLIRAVNSLKDRLYGDAVFEHLYRRHHVEGFYRFLRRAGRWAPVLVIQGNHDENAHYSTERINAIRGCQEISGKRVEVKGTSFLGVSHFIGNRRGRFKELEAAHPGGADVVIAHPPLATTPFHAKLANRLLIKGHYWPGTWMVEGKPTVFTSEVHHSVIELTPNGYPRISQWLRLKGGFGRFEEDRRARWFTQLHTHKPWIRPYPFAAVAPPGPKWELPAPSPIPFDEANSRLRQRSGGFDLIGA
jgi:Icc-related predicted phosphoesterase